MGVASSELTLLKEQRQQLTDVGWDVFKEKREVTDSHLRRMAKVRLDPWLAAYAEDIQIQSPDLEYYLQQLNDILTLDQAKIELTSLDQKTRAKDDVEDLRIYGGSLWRKFNQGQVLDRFNAEGVNRYGFAAMRLFCEMPGEPDDDGDDDVLDQVKRLVNRNQHFEERDNDDFRTKPVHPLTLRWWPLEPKDAEIFIEEVVLSYVEKVKTGDGKWAQIKTIGDAQQYVAVGTPAPVADSLTQQSGKKIHFITRAVKSEGKWTVTEFLFAGGSIDSGGQVNEYEWPGPDGPYVVMPSGAELATEPTPEKRFRPRMQALFVDYVEKNFWATMIAALGLKETREVYLNLAAFNQQQQETLEALFPTEGEGAQRRLVFALPRPGTGEIMSVPGKIEKANPELSRALEISLKNNDDSIARHAPNRFQTGNLSPTEISEGTGTAIINTMEASRLPPSKDLARIAHGVAQVIERCFAAIRYWDAGSPSGTLKRYPAVVTGEEPLLRAGPEIGTRVWVDGEKASRPYQLSVKIQNMTQAEEQVSSLLAFQDRAQGIITDEMLIQRRGGMSAARQFEDPGKLLQELERAKARKAIEPYKMQVATQILSVGAATLSGFNIPALMGLTPPTPAPTPETPPPMELASNRTPGGPPVAKPAFMSDINQTPPPPAPRSPGPQMTPAPVTSPAGSG